MKNKKPKWAIISKQKKRKKFKGNKHVFIQSKK